jgi:hypothetical protein
MPEENKQQDSKVNKHTVPHDPLTSKKTTMRSEESQG